MKKAISLLMAGLMVCSFVLAGCQQKDIKVSSNTFKIGALGPLTGELAFYGKEVQNGMMIAVEEINAAGGICDKTVEVNFLDDEADSEKVIEEYNVLKEWGMHTLLGAVTSDACIALSAETEKDNIFQVTPSSSAVESINHYNAFQVCFSDPNQGAAAAEYIAENKLGKRIAVVYDMSSSYSVGIFRGFSDKAHELGVEMVSIQGFSKENNSDFTYIIKEIIDKKSDLVFLPMYYQEASIFLKQASNLGCTAQYLGCDGMEGILEVEGFDAKYAEGLMYLTPFVSGDMSADAVLFSKKYEEAYGRKPSQFAADAYDAVYVIKTAAEEAGVTVNMSAEKMCEAMVGVMTVISFEGITSADGTKMSWDRIGTVDKVPKVAIIQDGQYKLK